MKACSKVSCSSEVQSEKLYRVMPGKTVRLRDCLVLAVLPNTYV